MQTVKAIPEEFQHALMVADINTKIIRKVMKMTCIERREIILLENEIRKRFKEKVIESTNLWGQL